MIFFLKIISSTFLLLFKDHSRIQRETFFYVFFCKGILLSGKFTDYSTRFPLFVCNFSHECLFFASFCVCVCVCALCNVRSSVVNSKSFNHRWIYFAYCTNLCFTHLIYGLGSTFLLFVTGQKGVFVCFSLIKGRVVVCFVCIFLFFSYFSFTIIIILFLYVYGAETLHKDNKWYCVMCLCVPLRESETTFKDCACSLPQLEIYWHSWYKVKVKIVVLSGNFSHFPHTHNTNTCANSSRVPVLGHRDNVDTNRPQMIPNMKKVSFEELVTTLLVWT